MFKDLKEFYLWLKMKRQIAKYTIGCVVCQEVKVEHQRLAGLSQPLFIP